MMTTQFWADQGLKGSVALMKKERARQVDGSQSFLLDWWFAER